MGKNKSTWQREHHINQHHHQQQHHHHEETANMATPGTPEPTPTPTPEPTPEPTPTPGANTETPQQAIDQVKTDVASDVAAVKTEAGVIHEQARADYDTLSVEGQRRFHQFLNDLEVFESKALGALHGMFGPKS